MTLPRKLTSSRDRVTEVLIASSRTETGQIARSSEILMTCEDFRPAAKEIVSCTYYSSHELAFAGENQPGLALTFDLPMHGSSFDSKAYTLNGIFEKAWSTARPILQRKSFYISLE